MIPRAPPSATMKIPRQLFSSLPHASPSARLTPYGRAGARSLHLHTHLSQRPRRPAIFSHPLPPTTPSPSLPPRLFSASTSSSSSSSSSSSPSPAAPPPAAAPSPTADALMERLTDLYSTAQDEFEIAAEETAKRSTYGPDDRQAAHEAFGALKAAYDEAVAEAVAEAGEGDGVGVGVAEEVQRRVGPRIRELEAALRGMDEMALQD